MRFREMRELQRSLMELYDPETKKRLRKRRRNLYEKVKEAAKGECDEATWQRLREILESGGAGGEGEE